MTSLNIFGGNIIKIIPKIPNFSSCHLIYLHIQTDIILNKSNSHIKILTKKNKKKTYCIINVMTFKLIQRKANIIIKKQ